MILSTILSKMNLKENIITIFAKNLTIFPIIISTVSNPNFKQNKKHIEIIFRLTESCSNRSVFYTWKSHIGNTTHIELINNLLTHLEEKSKKIQVSNAPVSIALKLLKVKWKLNLISMSEHSYVTTIYFLLNVNGYQG